SCAKDHPDVWNRDAFRASLADISILDGDEIARPVSIIPPPPSGFPVIPVVMPFRFTYVVENRMGHDFRTDGASVMAMVRRPDGRLSANPELRVHYPIFLPAQHKVEWSVDMDVRWDPTKSNPREALRQDMQDVSSFVLLDPATHYEIDLPINPERLK